MFSLRFLPFLAFILLNGCATAPEKPVAIVSEKPNLLLKKRIQAFEKKMPAEVKGSFASNELFMLLTAEIAGQRGQYEIALEGYLETAKRVNDARFAERAAMIAMYIKDEKKLSESVQLWLKQEPNSLSARKLAIISALRLGDKSLAVKNISEYLKKAPADFEKAILEVASTMQKPSKVQFIFDMLEEVAAESVDKAMVYFVQSVMAMKMNNMELAATKIQQALRVQPNWERAVLLQAQVAVVSGNNVIAISVLKNALHTNPNHLAYKKLLAQVFVRNRNYAESVQIYKEIVKQDATDLESQMALGLIYLQTDQDGLAQHVFKKLLTEKSWQEQAYFYLGKLAEKKGFYTEAIDWYDQVAAEPFAFDAAASVVMVLAKDKQYSKAEVRLQVLLQKYPKQQVKITLLHAEIYSQQKKYQEAYDILSTALMSVPNDNDLLYTRALVAERLNKLDIVESDLSKVLQSNPNHLEALNALGYTLANKTLRFEEAEKFLLQALDLAPEEPVILDSYGWLQYKLGHLAKALVYLQKAYAKEKENEILVHVIEVLWESGRKEEARKLFKEAIRVSPEDAYLQELQRRKLDLSL